MDRKTTKKDANTTKQNTPAKQMKVEDDFRSLVEECISAYAKLNNDSLALDYCKVNDRRLRSMILSDIEYRRETKSIYAKQRLEEIEELEHLSKLLVDDEESESDEGSDGYIRPNERGKKKEKQSAAVDRDKLAMRLKTTQMRREVRAELAKSAGDTESEVSVVLFVPSVEQDFLKLLEVELHEGVEDVDMDELLDRKEKLPEGSTGNLRVKSKTELAPDDDYFEVLEDGTVIEK